MQALRALVHECPPETLIIRTATGAPSRHADMRLYLHALRDDAGMPRINVPRLGHVAAKLTFEVIASIYLVQQLLGHGKVGVALAVYGYPARDESVVVLEIDRLLNLDDGV